MVDEMVDAAASSYIWPIVCPLPILPELTFRVVDGRPSSRCCRERKRACFFFSPWSRFMIISRIWGRYLSRFWGDASWLRVSSRIWRSISGTGPRSAVSTPMALKARQARLNS